MHRNSKIKRQLNIKKWYCFKKKLKKIEPISQYGTLINIGVPSNKETKEAARGRIRMDKKNAARR